MNILICGFGHAGKSYLSALKLKKEKLNVSIFDIDKSIDLPIDTNLITDFKNKKFDLSIISTPPEHHYDSLKSVINISNLVIIEKPISISFKEYQKIIHLSNKYKNVFFSFHALYGKELKIFKNYQNLNKYKEFKVYHNFYDPYLNNEKGHLGGPFWDSIYNVISCFIELFPFELLIKDIKIIKDNSKIFNSQIIYSNTNNTKKITQEINIKWGTSINYKISHLIYNKQCINISHSDQLVSNSSGKTIEKIEFLNDRLTEHYSLVLKDALSSMDLTRNSNFEKKISDIVWQIANKR